MSQNIKQVIVMRKLNMRRGKEIAQGSHASMAFMAIRVKALLAEEVGWNFTTVQKEWLEGLHTKVTLQVETEQELLSVYEAAKTANLEVHLITDAGLTEFNGVPTVTCLAIGPDYSEKIDAITKNLKLY